jgi:hypothetical protein
MTYLEAQIAELETKAAEFSLIADLATDPDERERNEQLAEELRKTIDCLRRSSAVRLPVAQ